MGSGGSIAAGAERLDLQQCKELAGEKFDQAKFDEVAGACRLCYARVSTSLPTATAKSSATATAAAQP